MEGGDQHRKPGFTNRKLHEGHYYLTIVIKEHEEYKIRSLDYVLNF